MREFPDRCKQNFGSASEVKEEAKMSFNLIPQNLEKWRWS